MRLHPENPHYFLFGGKPTVLITSGEHYGAVLNREFDYKRYLDTYERRAAGWRCVHACVWPLDLPRSESGDEPQPADVRAAEV